MYISVKTLQTLKLCSNVALGKWCLPYVDVIFLANFSALISSVEWLDFYNDSEGVCTPCIRACGHKQGEHRKVVFR